MAKDKTEIEGVKDKVQEKRRKLAAKIAAKRAKIALKRGLALLALAVVAGCGTFERADPAARSARAQYTFGNIQVDNGSSLTINLGDGALAAADGDGGISQPTTTTTSVPTTFSVPAAMDPVSAGIQAVTTLASKGIDAYAQTHGAQQSAPSVPSAGCQGGQCSETPNCPGGACEYREAK